MMRSVRNPHTPITIMPVTTRSVRESVRPSMITEPSPVGTPVISPNGGLEQAHIDRAHAEDGVEQDREECAEKYQEYRRIRPEPEEYHRERQPGSDGNRPQQVDGRIQQLPQDPDTSDHQPERNADQRREKKAAVDPRHRLP